ncbi:interferon gamma receptor 2 precursor [Astyanax mexicanus]|uniref:Interferon gamma receptor 2 n=1 Tax=Astyanax mexicanus TaxID=7994 RepID=A0A8T2LIG7_ASTMX|nr:interferon gamma receptor 2 precursor [Astyanax mexicanus]
MDWRNTFVSCLVFFIPSSACLSELPPPQHVVIESSTLRWNPPLGESNFNYTVQFSKVPEEEWHYVCGCNQTQFNFTAASEDFYGRIFRIRTETTNQSSAWIPSEQVLCEHTATCSPLFNLTVKSDKVYLWTGHKDQSLKREFGGHIVFKALYWKEDQISNKQEYYVGGGTLKIEGLKSGQKYCFQVVYLAYSKLYGRPSRVLCQVIPISPAQENIQIIVVGILIVVVLFGFGVCLYCFYKNYKKVKLFLQPPLDIPEHIQKFFSEELPHQQLVSNGTQELELDNIVMYVSEDTRKEEEDRSDAVL